MAEATPTEPKRKLDFKAAVLSYLIPGLGQVLQGRTGKGLLFFFGIYALFYYGHYMGETRNVWLPPGATVTKLTTIDNEGLPVESESITPTPVMKLGPIAFAGPLKGLSYRPQFLGQFWVGIAAWPAIAQNMWGQYLPTSKASDDRKGLPVIGRYMITPTEEELNNLQREGDKRWDLGWVYTLIAGALNLLVIYDALAGPAIRDDLVSPAKPEGGAA